MTPRLLRARLGWVGLLLLAALVLPSASGCSGKNRVSGKVTLNGAPVKNGIVTFIGANQQQKVANIGSDGEYILEDPPAGDVQVTVTSLTTNLPVMGGGRLPMMKDMKDKLPPPPPAGEVLPKKYANPNNGLTFNVSRGRQTFNIELTP